MRYTSLDTIIKGYLLQRKYPIHFYVDFLIYAQRGFEELSFDTIGNIRTVKLTVNDYAAATLPDDYVDWCKIGVENGQFVKPLIQRPGMNRLNNYQYDRFIASLGTIVPGSGYTASPSSGMATLAIYSVGTGYTNGYYPNVPANGGAGTGATVNITIAGGVVSAVSIVTPGNGYAVNDLFFVPDAYVGGTGAGTMSIKVLSLTNGVYSNVPLTGGLGFNAIANITVVSGAVTVVTIVAGGTAYQAGDVLSALTADIGGTGSGFSVPVASINSTNKILFPDDLSDDPVGSDFGNTGNFSGIWPWFGFGVQWNDHQEYTGRHYGAAINRTDSFKVLPERNEIQLHNHLPANYIVLEYLSDGSEIDNATQITPYAKAAIEAFINWKYKENSRSCGEGERMRAQRQFDHQHTILRGRMSQFTLSDLRGIIYRNAKGSPK